MVEVIRRGQVVGVGVCWLVVWVGLGWCDLFVDWLGGLVWEGWSGDVYVWFGVALSAGGQCLAADACGVVSPIGGRSAALSGLQRQVIGKFVFHSCVLCVGFVWWIFRWRYLWKILYGDFVWECCV